MLMALNREIVAGELLFHDDFTDDDLSSRWEITGGEWTVKDGVLEGIYRENAGGLIYTTRLFPGDIMLDYYGLLVAPCCNDLNFTFRAIGWDYKTGDAGVGYIGGLGGWWKNRAGIEKYPECRLQALTELFPAESEREYHIQTGIADDFIFLAVDGKMIVTLRDPEPITAAECMRVGLGTYCSHARFRDFKIYRAVVSEKDLSYTPQF